MSSTNTRSQVDLQWFRTHLLDEILPRWSLSVTEEGLFLPHFDREWRPLSRDYGTLVSQSRLLYNFSKGYELTQDPAYLAAVQNGARFLLEHFHDTQRGGWFWSCNLSGEVLEDRKDSYGHAFVIFGLSHAYQCTGDAVLRDAAFDTWHVFQDQFRDAQGGYVWRMDRHFQEPEPVKSQNPIMHLFEALLAAATLDGATEMKEAARSVGEFVLNKLVRASDGRLPEVYDEEWKELPPGPMTGTYQADGGRIDIGHAFEWSFLLSTAVDQGLLEAYLAQAHHFIDYGLELGFDAKQGGIYSPAAPDGTLISRRKGWWEQCEAIRALLHFALRRERADFWPYLTKTLAYVQTEFVDDKFGGWFAQRAEGSSPFVQEKGNEWKLDYHVVGMCMEAIRLDSDERNS